MSSPIDFNTLNQSELLEIVRLSSGQRFKYSTPADYLVLFLQGQTPLNREYLSGTVETRARLERWILNEWNAVESQLPCKGANRGHCTIYPCADGRHLDCWLRNKGKLL